MTSLRRKINEGNDRVRYWAWCVGGVAMPSVSSQRTLAIKVTLKELAK
jgi:hypothetical protein